MQLDALLETIDVREPTLIMGDFNTITDTEPNTELVQFYEQNPELANQLRTVIMFHQASDHLPITFEIY